MEEVVTEERLFVVLRGCSVRQVCWEPEVRGMPLEEFFTRDPRELLA